MAKVVVGSGGSDFVLLNSHISANATCFAEKVCHLLRSTWGICGVVLDDLVPLSKCVHILAFVYRCTISPFGQQCAVLSQDHHFLANMFFLMM